MSKEEHILVVQPLMDALANRLASRFICHNLYQCENSDEYLRQHGEKFAVLPPVAMLAYPPM
ncbi:hypothetical protein [Gibbsiella quercinecans]|uniref:hypothetical protein n=1 Tax=Gibbsiella quercinecans TaxID=929813 RepID=UPI00242E9731|nr:hypothetical protein [Gibbsiella quercinecans]